MDDHKSKEEQRERHRRAMKRSVGYEEGKQRKAESAARRAERRSSVRQRHDWDEDDESFEKIRRTRRAPTGGKSASSDDPTLIGLPWGIVAAVHYGRVTLDDGETVSTAGEELAVGDEVALAQTDGPARIAARIERRTCLSRPDPGDTGRTLVIAANVDVAVIVAATKDPPLRPGLIDRLLFAVERGGVTPVVCVNKVDLLHHDHERRELDTTVEPYAQLGHAVFLCAATTGEGVDELREHLSGRTCVFVGHSGVGKSSVLNAIDPRGQRGTGDVRRFDGRGRHTTTWSSMRVLGEGTRVIDTPGVRAFGLDELSPAQVRAGFEEFVPISAGCRYSDCTPIPEPQCAVREAVEDGQLPAARYASYTRILSG